MDFSRLASRLSPEKFRGLRSPACICVGTGFSREDFKSFLLKDGVGFTGSAVLTFPQLAEKISKISPERILKLSPSRQEILRLLLSVPGTSERFRELKRLKRQGSFWKRLDLAIQTGRMSFVHWEEARVFSARLLEKNGENLLREEIEKLALAYESWMESSRHWDPPLVLREAIKRLEEEGAAALKDLPKEFFYFSTQEPESLERAFWEQLSRIAQVHADPIAQYAAPPEVLPGTWERWHTLDDASDSLADSLAKAVLQGESLEDHVVLIADHPPARRSLKRALGARHIPLADSRDPTRTRWDEGLKRALLPLEVVARGFEREQVLSWIATVTAHGLESVTWVKEIQERGIRSGLESYAGGKLVALHAELSKLQGALGGKRTLRELGLSHLKQLEAWLSSDERFADQAWLIAFCEQIWRELALDMERVDLGDRRAQPLYWLERVQNRVNEAPAPAERLKASRALDVFRFHQAPVKTYRKVWFLGIPPGWLSGEGIGDYWFSERDREVLALDFSVRSGAALRRERLRSLKEWTEEAREVHVFDSLYDPGGREREAISSVIRELEGLGRFKFSEAPEERGSHLKWLKSYRALRPIQPQTMQLGQKSEATLSATLLDTYSRCSFQALAGFRWKLRDTREPDTDLWPDVRGNILHEAVRLLVQSRDGEGNFSLQTSQALELAWAAKRPRGLLRGARIEAYVKRRLKIVLNAFCEKEREYVQRSKTSVLSLEDVKFEVPFQGFTVIGEPDRIDEHPDGLFILDYKTSSRSPKGMQMIEHDYHLQLPFYAVAAQKKFGKPVLGFQFVQLDRDGTRSAGIFFKSHNGKEAGKLTATTANSKSLVTLDRDEVWSRFESAIQEQGTDFIQGLFEARPRVLPREEECKSCRVSDLCGLRRLADDGEEED